MTIASLYSDLLIFGVFLILGLLVREVVKPLQKLYLPASLIGGALLLIVGNQGIGLLEVPESFSGFSGVLINIMLTGIVFGVTINKERVKGYLDYCCANQSVYGMQMLLGPALGVALAAIWNGLPQGWGIMGLFAFHGGHGTAATAGSAFEDLGIAENQSIGMVLATIGLIVAMVVGMAVVNFGIRKGWAKYVKEIKNQPDWTFRGPLPEDKRTSIGSTVTNSISINHLALQTAWLFVAFFVGKMLIQGLTMLWPGATALPSMIQGIIGAAILWPILRVVKLDKLVDKKAISQICGFCLELIVLTAVATLNLKFVAAYLTPIIIYSVIMCGLTVLMDLYLPYKFSKDDWFEKGVMILGHTTGTGATGFALLRAVDPDAQSEVGDAHGVYSALSCWQNLFPALTPVWLMTGIGLTCGIGAVMLFICAGAGFVFFARSRKKAMASQAS